METCLGSKKRGGTRQTRAAAAPIRMERNDPMKLSNLIRPILKTAVYILDQTAEQVDRASERASDLADDAKEAIYPQDHTLRNLLTFGAGVGVGVGVGMLLAPTSGTELRSSISDKVQDIGNKVRGRGMNYATGTEL
jgi:gas vesicle protein